MNEIAELVADLHARADAYDQTRVGRILKARAGRGRGVAAAEHEVVPVHEDADRLTAAAMEAHFSGDTAGRDDLLERALRARRLQHE